MDSESKAKCEHALMKSASDLRVIERRPAGSERLTRREMVQRLLAGTGAGAAWPLVAKSHPICALLANEAVFEEAEKLGAVDWKPLVLSPQQNEMLIALAERIVPGSTTARVNRFMDLLLSVDTTEHKQKFMESLAAFESESRKRFGKQFPALDSGEQNLILERASKDSAKEDSTNGNAGDNHTALHEYFENLKGWMSGAYYSSEAGMRELGWTGNYVYESFPGCAHAEGHH